LNQLKSTNNGREKLYILKQSIMANGGIDPNDLFFDSDSFWDFEDVVVDPGAVGIGRLEECSKKVQFHPLVSVYNAEDIPLAGGDTFWDTQQYGNATMGNLDMDNSGSFSLNDFGSVSDESLGDFNAKDQIQNPNGWKKFNGLDVASSARCYAGIKKFDKLPKSRTVCSSGSDDDAIGLTSDAACDTLPEQHTINSYRDQFFSEDDIHGRTNEAKISSAVQEQVNQVTRNAYQSNHATTTTSTQMAAK
jgi:sulfur transfer complex TusBCD TusB component (DsrH family)